MKFIRGFGKTYFTLAAIQAYASAIHLLKLVTRITWINLISSIHVHSTLSPPKDVLSFLTIIFITQGHSCINIFFHSSRLRH